MGHLRPNQSIEPSGMGRSGPETAILHQIDKQAGHERPIRGQIHRRHPGSQSATSPKRDEADSPTAPNRTTVQTPAAGSRGPRQGRQNAEITVIDERVDQSNRNNEMRHFIEPLSCDGKTEIAHIRLGVEVKSRFRITHAGELLLP